MPVEKSNARSFCCVLRVPLLCCRVLVVCSLSHKGKHQAGHLVGESWYTLQVRKTPEFSGFSCGKPGICSQNHPQDSLMSRHLFSFILRYGRGNFPGAKAPRFSQLTSQTNAVPLDRPETRSKPSEEMASEVTSAPCTSKLAICFPVVISQKRIEPLALGIRLLSCLKSRKR